MNGVRERRAENHVELVPHLHGQNGPTHLAQSTGFGVSFELSEVPHQGQSRGHGGHQRDPKPGLVHVNDDVVLIHV